MALVKMKNAIHEITSVRDLSVVRESISLYTRRRLRASRPLVSRFFLFIGSL